MRRFLLPLAVVVALQPLSAETAGQRKGFRPVSTSELGAADFAVTDSARSDFGRAPDLGRPAPAAAVKKILPPSGSFIDEPGLPYLTGFSFTYPYSVYELSYPDMTETTIVEDATQFPSSVYLREGNFEGNAFSDNPSGTTVMMGSFDVAGNKNWQYTQYITKANSRKRPLRSAYDEREDRVYALSAKVRDTKEAYCFISFSPTNFNDMKVINENLTEAQNCSALTWDPRDGSIVGVTVTGDVVRYDKKTGVPQVIFNTGHPQNHVYFAGLAYSPRHNGFIWAWLPTQDGATLSQDFYLIDTEKKTCKLIHSTPKSDAGLHQMSALMVNEQYVNPLAPAPAAISSEGTSASGASHTIEITLPSKKENGTALAGNLRLVVRVGGITNVEGTRTIERTGLAPGSKVSIPLGSLSDGLHRVSIYTVDADEKWSRRLSLAKFVGEDTPLPPANVKLTTTTLSWDPVTTGVKGQSLAGKNITYEVWVDEKMVGTTSSTSYAMDFDPVELLSHMAAVSAVNGSKKSALSFSDRISMGQYRTIPAHFVPGASDVLFASTIDMDADGIEWGYDDYYEAWRKPMAYGSGKNDDWLYLPPLRFDDPQALYEISFEWRSGDADSEIELIVADQSVAKPWPQTLSFKGNTGTDFKPFSTVINAKDIKYLGFHPVSQSADFFVRNIKVTKTGGDLNSPVAVSDLKVTSGPEGATTATVEFTAPTKTVAGAALNSSAQLSFRITGNDLVETTATGLPGQKVTAQATGAEGLIDLTVTPILDSRPGLPATFSYFNGEDVPGHVKDFSVTLDKDPSIVHIGYKSPGHDGYHGGWSSTEGLKYYLLLKRSGASKWTRYNPVTYCGIQFTINADQPQEYVQWGVMTENNKGYSNKWPQTAIACGPAYKLPMRETMAGGRPVYNPVVTEFPTDEYIAGTGFADPRQINPDYAVPSGRVIGMMPPADEKPGKAMIQFPYFSTEGVAKPALNIRVLLDPECTTHADVYANIYGKQGIKVGSWGPETPGKGFTTLRFELPDELKNQKWVQLYVDGIFEGGPVRRYVAIERYTVSETRANDMTLLSASTPANMSVNREAIIRATVLNNSSTAKAAPEVKLSYTDGAGVKTDTRLVPVSEGPLGIDEEREYTYKFIPTADALGEMTFNLSLPDDDVAEGNTYQATGNVVVGDVVMSPYLKATRNTDDPSQAHLEWGRPHLFDGTEDMENLPAFSIDENLGSFINLDLDGSLTYSWQNWDFPHEEEPHAFIVFDDRHEAIPEASRQILKAHSGHQFLLALSPLNYVTANDWLISPEVQPGSDISFWLSTVSTSYGADMVGVYWSKGSTDPEDFEMLAYIRKKTEGWEELSYTLPAEAKRFAIKYYSNDTFGIMLDDISYTPADGIATLEGFDVMRDGKSVARLHRPVYEYTDTGLDKDTEYRYNVVPYTRTPDGTVKAGESSPTAIVRSLSGISQTEAEAEIIVSGRRIIVGAHPDARVSATTLSGISMVPESRDDDYVIYRVNPGVYVITVGNQSAKVMVR